MMRGIKRDERFERTFAALYPRARRLAMRVTGDGAVAEEVAAEALARAFADWGRLVEVEWLDGWVLRVTTNLALNVVARKRPVLDHPPVSDPQDVAAVHVALVDALAKLPVRQREAVVLRHLADLSEAEVARSLGVSPGTVKTHVHRGLEALRRLLGENESEEVPLVLAR